MAKSTALPDYYKILDIQNHYTEPINLQELKQAYHRALLKHHPDKTNAPGTYSLEEPCAVTVDQVTAAYKVLSDPRLRAEYDKDLRLKCPSWGSTTYEQVFHTGLEIVDLDDLMYDESSGEWFRSCRCGEKKGFVLRENDLEEEATTGEIISGCRSCSLWLKVLFAPEVPDTVNQISTTIGS
ncbi:MAG: hypothetical protein M1834_006364 [Cirrosporium novae-zelandiae]|nr:MAG: hypothetical protein M1834_006364 [Cirrosporium novae-zelandiae]